MEVIICSVYITHIVAGKVLSPSCQQLVTKCMFLYILHAFIDSFAECCHSDRHSEQCPVACLFAGKHTTL